MDKNKALTYLLKEPVKNCNIINFMHDYPIKSIEREGNSISVVGNSDRQWIYFSSENTEEFKKLLKKYKREKNFAITNDWQFSVIEKNREIAWNLTCLKLYLPENRKIHYHNKNVKKLRPEHADYIYKNYTYKEFTDVHYLKDRINKSGGFGFFIDEKLVGWVLTHDDGAIGILHVMKNYRKKGYAEALMLSIINKLRIENKIPFAQIVENNTPSMNLAKKLGFIPLEEIHWIEFK
jgi:8-oxo-dGTP diphosphatase